MDIAVVKESQALDEGPGERLAVASRKSSKRRKKKKTSPRWVQNLGGLCVARLVKSLMGTLDCQADIADPTVDPFHGQFVGPVIYVVWHEYLLLPLYLRGPENIATLASRHSDAEWVARAAEHLGFETVRGSCRRGGQTALLKILRAGRPLSLAITCDGPSGPRRRMAPGAVFLSSKLGIPLVAMGIGYSSPWRAGSWDRFAIPKPWSRARTVVMPRYQVPAEADRDQMEACREEFEAILKSATADAEAWAESGADRQTQVALKRMAPGGSTKRA